MQWRPQLSVIPPLSPAILKVGMMYLVFTPPVEKQISDSQLAGQLSGEGHMMKTTKTTKTPNFFTVLDHQPNNDLVKVKDLPKIDKIPKLNCSVFDLIQSCILFELIQPILNTKGQ